MLNNREDKLAKKGFVPPDPSMGGAPQGGAPQGGAPQGGAPQGGMPPMDPAMMGMPPGGGGAPPMDPAMMGMPPMPPEGGAGGEEGMPPPGGDPASGGTPEDPVVVSASDMDQAIEKAVEAGKKESGSAESESKSGEGDRVAQLEKEVEELRAMLEQKPVEGRDVETSEPPPDANEPQADVDDLVDEMFTEEAKASNMRGDEDELEKTSSDDWNYANEYSRILDTFMNMGDRDKREQELKAIEAEY